MCGPRPGRHCALSHPPPTFIPRPVHGPSTPGRLFLSLPIYSVPDSLFRPGLLTNSAARQGAPESPIPTGRRSRGSAAGMLTPSLGKGPRRAPARTAPTHAAEASATHPKMPSPGKTSGQIPGHPASQSRRRVTLTTTWSWERAAVVRSGGGSTGLRAPPEVYSASTRAKASRKRNSECRLRNSCSLTRFWIEHNDP